jgi:putative ABC transport system permease protein
MNIFNSYKRSRFFLWVNITGLAIGLAASILLILFVVNEWSYDKHFANANRIVRLLTVFKYEGQTNYAPINLRKAYTELPALVPGVEATAQLFNFGKGELIHERKRFQEVKIMLADPEIFQVFQMKFIEGNPETSLSSPNAMVVTRRYADILFGSPKAAMNQSISFSGVEYVISGVVEELPQNTHFNFDVLGNMKSISWVQEARGLEFHTYYLVRKETPVETVRTDIENTYRTIVKPLGELVGDPDAHGQTEMLGDVYLKSNATHSLGTTGSWSTIWILTGLALFILILAVTNFINLFITQSEMRMQEIGIRKTNGAQINDIIRQFFSEISVIVFIAITIGLCIAVLCLPAFGKLLGKEINPVQLLSPSFALAILALFILTVILSSFYPAIYLSRFSPLEILGKRIRFSRRRLTAVIVIFQSIISIILLSVILLLHKNTAYLEKIPLGYHPENVMSVIGSQAIDGSYQAIRQELLKLPEVKAVTGSHHIFGGGCSGQAISTWGEQGKSMGINEYRILTGMPEMMELELVEGRFWREDDPDSIPMLILNEAAVKMMGGESPLDKTYSYRGQAKVTGVVKDFYYGNPVLSVEPLMLFRVFNAGIVNIRFNEKVNPIHARQITEDIFHQFDPDFVLNPIWNEDIYKEKFKGIKTSTRMILIGTITSIVVAMLGLLAIHLFSAVRRTKEIGIRRIHGAKKMSVFVLLSLDVLKWIGFAALITLPITFWCLSEILSHYANHVRLDWTMFAFPILTQCFIALLTTSGVSLSVLSQNPVKSLKSE